MPTRMRIGDLLVESGLLTIETLQKALNEQKELDMRLGDLLISRNYITEQQLIEVLEFQLGIPHIQIHRHKIDSKIINIIPKRMAEQHIVLPIRTEDNKLVIAMADPLDYFAIDELRMYTGFQIEPLIASKVELLRAITRYYNLQESVDQVMEDLQYQDVDKQQVKLEEEDSSPVVKTVNQIISQAVLIGASDIHFDPQEESLRIRYRVDGVMRTEKTLSLHMQNVIVARIKIMANLNVAERRLPQDGRVEMEIEYRKVDIRISTLPTIHGEKVVLRILDLVNTLTEISNLGFSQHNLNLFLKGIQSSYGIVLITGPTGSGKTTTLYSALSKLNNEEVNIITVEDPVEYQLEGINQVQVNSTKGLTFSSGLRTILRQDPNIVMVGEIRDTETAEISVRAAMTGHLVLSTLHTNSAVGAITRIIDMGVEPFLIASAISCIVAQRLVRRVCNGCAHPYLPMEEEKLLLDKHNLGTMGLMKGTGCSQCGQTGYKGRLAIHEVFVADDIFRSMILQKRADSDYHTYAIEHGLIPMLRDGLSKVILGQTTLEEVLRVTGSE